MVNIIISTIISLIVCHVYLNFYEKQNDKLLKEFLRRMEEKTIQILNDYLQDKR